MADLHYKNKVGLTFERYIMIINRYFFDLAQGNWPKNDEEKVELMCAKIMSGDPDIRAAVCMVSMDPNLNGKFSGAANTLLEQVTKIHPSQPSRGKRSYHNISGISHQGRGPGKHGRGSHGCSRQGGQF
eukprot:325194-Ditylum_brightwellii.AAC.1